MSIAGYVAREAFRAASTPPSTPPRNGTAEPAGTVALRQPAATTAATGAQRPAGKAIDGALLWALVRRYLSYYVAFRTEAELDRVTAWVFHACARRRGERGLGPLIWNATPRLLIKSRKRGAGKSTLLDLLVYLTGSRNGKTPRITPARLAQIIAQAHEAVFIDEGRLVFGAGARHEDLQACLLVGYTPNGSYLVSKTSLSVFGPVAIATKESLLTEASKAVDGDESSLGDLLDRCLTVTLTAPDFPMPEVGKRAEADGALLARALVAWTDTCRDALEDAAQDVADEDLKAARERAKRGEKATETPRALQIGRPLRAVGRVIDQQVVAQARRDGKPDPEPQCEATILACLGTQAEDIMAELEELSEGWEDAPRFTGGEDEDEPGRIIYDGEPPPPPAPAAQYSAGYARTQDGTQPEVKTFPGTWPSLQAAQWACEGHAAGEYGTGPLPWEPGRPGFWGATIHPAGPEGPEVSYAVHAASGE